MLVLLFCVLLLLPDELFLLRAGGAVNGYNNHAQAPGSFVGPILVSVNSFLPLEGL